MSNKPSSRKKEQRTAAAAKVAAMRRQQAEAERRRRVLVGAAVAAVVAVIIGAAVFAQSRRDTSGNSDAAVPANLVGSQGFLRGDSTAPVRLVMYEDFMCPVCGQFEKGNATFLAQQVGAGTVQVEYRPISFLDRLSNGTEYSTRAANALGCVVDSSGAKAAGKFHDLLYANQPAEGGDGLPDSQLADLAAQAGAQPSTVQRCITNGTYRGWVANATDQSSKDGVNGTPTAVLDGAQLSESQTLVPTSFQGLVDQAVAAVSAQQ